MTSGIACLWLLLALVAAFVIVLLLRFLAIRRSLPLDLPLDVALVSEVVECAVGDGCWDPGFVHGCGGWGGIAVNEDSTLVAMACDHDVRVFHAAACPIACAPAAFGNLAQPRHICFAGANVLVVDAGPNTVLEFSIAGAFVRNIVVRNACWLHGIAHSRARNVIALSLGTIAVVVVDYTSCAILHRIQHVWNLGLRFTPDGSQLVFRSYFEHMGVAWYWVDSGKLAKRRRSNFHTAAETVDMAVSDDGGVVLATHNAYTDAILFLNADGTLERMVFVDGPPTALAWLGTDVCYKIRGEDRVHVIPSKWSRSTRCAFIMVCIFKGSIST